MTELKQSVALIALVFFWGSMCLADEEASAAQSLLGKGTELWIAGDLAGALASYRQAVARDPQWVDARLKLAGVYMARQEYGEAVEAFQAAIGIDATDPKPFIGMAIAYWHGRDYGHAHAAFEEAVRLDPSRYKQIAPHLARLEGKMTHPVPRQSSRDLREHIKAMP